MSDDNTMNAIMEKMLIRRIREWAKKQPTKVLLHLLSSKNRWRFATAMQMGRSLRP